MKSLWNYQHKITLFPVNYFRQLHCDTHSMVLIWQQVVMACCRFLIFHKFFGRYFDRYVFKHRYKILVSVKLQLRYKKVFYLCIWFSKGLTARGKAQNTKYGKFASAKITPRKNQSSENECPSEN